MPFEFSSGIQLRAFQVVCSCRCRFKYYVLGALPKLCQINDAQNEMSLEFNLPFRESNVIIIKESPTLSYVTIILLSAFESLVLVGSF